MVFQRILLLSTLPLVSGAAALVHELLWTRRLVDLLGATEWVVGQVLGLFFLGLSLGGYLASRPIWQSGSPLVRLGIAESLVAIFSLPAAFLPAWSDWIWLAMGTEALAGWQGAALKSLISGAVILPPAVAMGFTLPLFVRACMQHGRQFFNAGLWVYFFNTLGGVFGLWLASTTLLPSLGGQKTMLLAALFNVTVALVVFALAWLSGTAHKDSGDGSGQAEKNGPSGGDESAAPLGRLLVVSFFSGLVVLALEVLLLRLVALVVPSSFFTTSAMLANVILVLAAGTAVIGILNAWQVTRKLVSGGWLLFLGLLGSAALMSYCPKLLFECTDQLISVRYLQSLNGMRIESISHYWQIIFWLVAAVGGVALFFSGLVFPVLLAQNSLSDLRGRRVGLLLAANGVGGLLGSMLGSSWLAGYLGVYVGFTVLAAAVLLVAFWFVFGTELNRNVAAICFVIASLVVFSGYRFTASLPYLSPRTTTKYEILATRFGEEGVLQVVRSPGGSKSILMNNQYLLGSTGAERDERRQLLLPWLMHSDARRICCLGLATGISASGLETVADPPAVTAVELSGTVKQVAGEFFAADLNGFFERTENSVVIEDARTYMAAADHQFDLIVADLFRPHGAGEGRLFTVEHYQNVQRALDEGGLFCQWLPVYQLNAENFERIAATFQSVFPNTLVVYGNLNARTPVVGLLAWKDGRSWQLQEMDNRLGQPAPELLRQDSLLASARGLVVGELKEDVFQGARLNTLDNMNVEISAGNFWVLKDLRKDREIEGYENEFLSGVQILEFNRRLKENTEPVLPRELFEQFERALSNKMR